MGKENIGGVAETMLQTLYARAKESKKPNHKIYDAKAIEIVEQMDYDFSAADKDAVMSGGVVARTIVLDRMVKDYIAKHPETTVVNIACGMDTRFYRVDNGKVSWYNIDLPATMDVREKFSPQVLPLPPSTSTATSALRAVSTAALISSAYSFIRIHS